MYGTFSRKSASAITKGILLLPVFVLISSFGTPATARQDLTIIEIRMGDYRFTPADVQITANQPAVLRLINTDGMTPHNFRLSAGGIDVDVLAGDSVDVELGPIPEGEYRFYCDKKLPFMKSHREKGMEADEVTRQEESENKRKWEVSRRRMLQLMGGAAVATGIGFTSLPAALRDDPADAVPGAAPAATGSQGSRSRTRPSHCWCVMMRGTG